MIPSEYKSIYQQKQDTGTLFVRDNTGSIDTASVILDSVYPLLYSIPTGGGVSVEYQLNNDGLRDFDVFYDTYMFYLSSHVIFAKVNYDYVNARIIGDLGDVSYIPLIEDTHISKFGGTWFNSKEKIVTICTLVSCIDNKIFPVLYTNNLETGDLAVLYDGTPAGQTLSSLNVTSFEEPVFTYNDLSQIYNISVVVYSPNFTNSVFGLVQYNIKAEINNYKLISVNVITPD